ncbi:MAG: WhiB family transcriptional regulator [Egibacteraceae bacterium]
MNPAHLQWRERAACLGEDTERYFPVGASGPALDQIEQAKRVCAACVVCSECLEYALETNQDGVWGGMSQDERRSLRRSRQRARQAAQRPRNCSS